MFIEPDEHIIVMEDDWVTPMSLEDYKKIESAGIRTVVVPHAVVWDKGMDDIDRNLEKAFQTDMKIILPFFYGLPDRYNPADYSSEEFGLMVDDFALEILDHYSDVKDRIQLIYSIPEGGEFLWDTVQRSNFPYSDETIATFIINRQKVLVEQHGEIWLCLHNYLGDKYNWNNVHLPNVHRFIRYEFPTTPFYSIQYAHFACGNTPTGVDSQMKVRQYAEEFGIRSFAGSEYCEGLGVNYNKIAEQKLWGFITCPMHSLNPIQHNHIEPWMVDVLAETNRRLKEEWSWS